MTQSRHIILKLLQLISVAQDRQFDLVNKGDARFDGCRTHVLRGSSSGCGVSADWQRGLWQKSIAEPARGSSVKRLESPGMSKEKARFTKCLFAASITGAWRSWHFSDIHLH